MIHGGNMPEQTERQKVDAFYAKKQAERKSGKTTKKPSESAKRTSKAAATRKSITDKVAPSGYQRLMSVLGG